MEINLQSLSTTPSDHECKDGDLSAMLNVINEDGALHAIPEPSVKATIVLQDKDGKEYGYDTKYARFYIHKTDNDDPDEDDHTNWISVWDDGTNRRILWCDDIYAEQQAWEETAAMEGLAVNAVTFTGRVVSLVGSTETRWLLWDGEGYKPYVRGDFGFQVRIWSESTEEKEYWATLEYADQNYVDVYGNVINDTSGHHTVAYGLSKSGMAYYLEHLDGLVNAEIENGNELHKYRSFGFCALRMYDGSYVRVSDIFSLGSADDLRHIVVKQKDTTLSAMIEARLHRHKIAVAMEELERVKSMVLGIDVFLCAPSLFYKTDETHKFPDGKGLMPWTSVEEYSFSLYFHSMTEDEMYDTVDRMSFHRVMRIETKDIGTAIAGAAEQYIPPFDETGSVLTLEDFGVAAYGASVAHNYNGRLNIGNVCRTVTFAPLAGIDYRWDDSYVRAANYPETVRWNDICYPVYDKSQQPKRFATATAYLVIRHADGNSRKTVYAMSKTEVPLPPIVMLPYPNIESADIYLGIFDSQSDWPDGYRNKYWRRKNLEFHTSVTGNWSYVITSGLNLMCPVAGIYNKSADTLTWALTGDFEEITAAEYVAAAEAYFDGAHSLNVRCRNSIFTSESGNPFVMKATTQVTVGDGTVLALQAPTQPISQGQAGSTPLVAFTSEGIYPLYVDASTGLYSATQPGPRDVIIKGENGYNTEAVTSIDNAILFPTDRGLMMYAGSGTQCLTDTLINKVYDVELPHLADIFDACGMNNSGTDKLSDYTLAKGLREYLKTCNIVYDYASQKIYLYQPTNSSFALVYSIRSGVWGMTDCTLRQSLNSYPDALAVDKQGRLVDMYNDNATEREFFAITRPIGFGAPHTLKRVAQSIIRGLFTKGKVKSAVYGSRDLQTWFLLTTSKDHCLRGRHGSPYKYYRYLFLGKLKKGETVEGISTDVTESMGNQLR